MGASDSVAALIAGAGSGQRLGGKPKALLSIGDTTLVEIVVEQLRQHVSQILVAVKPSDTVMVSGLLAGSGAEVLAGGATRQETLGLLLDRASADFVLIHDVARPFVGHGLIGTVIKSALRYGAAAPVLEMPVRDSLALRNGDCLGDPLDRSAVVAVQTPYVIRRQWLVDAYSQAVEHGWQESSTTTLLTRSGYQMRLVAGDPANRKITYVEDLDGL